MAVTDDKPLGANPGSPLTKNPALPHATHYAQWGNWLPPVKSIAERNALPVGDKLYFGVTSGQRTYRMRVEDLSTGTVYRLLPPGFFSLTTNQARISALASNDNWVVVAEGGTSYDDTELRGRVEDLEATAVGNDFVQGESATGNVVIHSPTVGNNPSISGAGQFDAIIGGDDHAIANSPASISANTIVGGSGNVIDSATQGTTIGGAGNQIQGGAGNQILGGSNNTIPATCNRVTLINCNNFTAPGGVSDVTYVDNALVGTGPGGTATPLSNATPAANGTAAAGTSAEASRADHVHPTDTSRAAASHTHTIADVTGLQAALNAKADSTTLETVRTTLAISTERTAAYTLALSDAGQLVPVNSASGVTITVPTNATAAFPISTIIQIRQRGAGQVTVAGASGVTVNAYGGLKTPGQWAEVGLHKTDTDTWVLTGGVA